MKTVSAPGVPSIDCLPVLVQTCSITACKCISKLARLLSPNWLGHSLQVYLQTRSITASKFTRSWPPSASTHLLDHCLQVDHCRLITPSKCISKLAQCPPSSVSLNSPNYGLQVHLQSRSITPSNCISKLALSQPPSESPNSLKHGHPSASLNLLNYSLQSPSRNSLNHGPRVYP